MPMIAIPLRRRARAVVAAIMIACALAISASAQDATPSISITIDETLDPDSWAGAAWLGYALARAHWILERSDSGEIDLETYRSSFAEEREARETMITIWHELKELNPDARDSYLDNLSVIVEAGFVQEYIYAYYRNHEWSDLPKELDIDGFRIWKHEALPDHNPQTRAVVAIE